MLLLQKFISSHKVHTFSDVPVIATWWQPQKSYGTRVHEQRHSTRGDELICFHLPPTPPTNFNTNSNRCYTVQFFGCVRKTAQKILLASPCLSVRLSVRMEQLSSHWTYFHEIIYLSIFRKSVREFKFHYNLTRKISNLHNSLHKLMIISAEFISEWAMFQTNIVEKIETRIFCSKYFNRKSCCL